MKKKTLAPLTSPVSEVDALYYQLLIKSWVLVGITVLFWTVTVVFCYLKLKNNE